MLKSDSVDPSSLVPDWLGLGVTCCDDLDFYGKLNLRRFREALSKNDVNFGLKSRYLKSLEQKALPKPLLPLLRTKEYFLKGSEVICHIEVDTEENGIWVEGEVLGITRQLIVVVKSLTDKTLRFSLCDPAILFPWEKQYLQEDMQFFMRWSDYAPCFAPVYETLSRSLFGQYVI